MIKISDGAVNLAIRGERETLFAIQDAFRWRPNRYFAHPQYIIWKQIRKREKEAGVPYSNKGWDGWKRPGKLMDSTLIIGRGWLKPILDLASSENLSVDLSSMISNPYAAVTPDDVPDDIIYGSRHMEQWELQKVVIAAILRAGCGRLKVTVSGGKTAILCCAASMVKKYKPNGRILYITPNERLVSQSTKEARKFLPKWSIGQYGGACREKDATDMVVATSAILNTNIEKLAKEKWFDSFVAVMCDECQYSASPSQQKILKACKAWFRFGVSDTTKEMNPEKNAILVGSFGPVLNDQIKAVQLIDMNQIAKPTIHVTYINSVRDAYSHLSHLPKVGTDAWVLLDGSWTKGIYEGQAYKLDETGEFELDKAGQPVPIPGMCYIRDSSSDLNCVESRWVLAERKYDKAIIRCKERTDHIKKKCLEWQTKNWRSLVIVTRTSHLMILESELKKVLNQNKLRILYGHDTLEQRDDTFEWLRNTPGAVLATPLVKVGTSINEIDAGIVADYVADPELANQFVGRFIRKKFHKTANSCEIVWFVENQHKAYARGSAAVIEWLKGIEGYDFVEDFI